MSEQKWASVMEKKHTQNTGLNIKIVRRSSKLKKGEHFRFLKNEKQTKII